MSRPYPSGKETRLREKGASWSLVRKDLRMLELVLGLNIRLTDQGVWCLGLRRLRWCLPWPLGLRFFCFFQFPASFLCPLLLRLLWDIDDVWGRLLGDVNNLTFWRPFLANQILILQLDLGRLP